jgi:hypothetical protein
MNEQPTIKDYIRCVFDSEDTIAKNAPKKQYMRMSDGTVKVFIEYPSPKPKKTYQRTIE